MGDCSSMDAIDDFSVSEGAFWHSNMELYYGYQAGEVVEVEHESNKYWLATIEYSYRHLILLKWVGDYGEFWVDTSNLQNSSATTFDEFNTTTKRLFPPGYHLQSQLKSQFTLERPTKVLVKPSLYNPANDPYADIKTVNDLLKHELEQTNDTFGNQNSTLNNEPASLVMAKCKTKISYGQADDDELEAALEALGNLDSSETTEENCKVDPEPEEEQSDNSSGTQVKTSPGHEESSKQESIDLEDNMSNSGKNDCSEQARDEPEESISDAAPKVIDHDAHLETCRNLQESAISKGRYVGIGDNSNKVFYLKPKQLFDIGGANHERVIVPGTLLEVCYSIETGTGLELFHWFVIVLKNVGGRLTLRWFLCDEPKFKQGRLELKSLRSEFIREDTGNEDDSTYEPTDSAVENKDSDNCPSPKACKMHAKTITFEMHFCNPCVHSISHARSTQRLYKMPGKMAQLIESLRPGYDILAIEKAQMEHVFDQRRMNLDKDRPIIDHLLSIVRWKTPQYLKLLFAPKDNRSKREVLLSTPKTTKLFRGFVKRELEAGVFEVHSEPVSDSGEIFKFIYPYDSSYTILPKSWSINNEDCLSIHPSRNPSPTPTGKSSDDSAERLTEDKTCIDECKDVDQPEQESDSLDTKVCSTFKLNHVPVTVGPYELQCEIAKANFQESDDSEDRVKCQDFDELEPSCWSRLLRVNELNALEFDCSIETTPMNTVLSKFRVMDQLEVVHPSSDVTICLGRIRKIVYPLLWIQISADSYTLLPFNSTNIYPSRWCETNEHSLISILPPRKRLNQSSTSQPDKKRKKSKNNDGIEMIEQHDVDSLRAAYEKEHFDLGALNDKQLDIDYILNEKTTYIRIYFNHKCFTGPSLSKGKICSLPQYVGPGPLRLVMDEVVTKVISVAYVPPRILNDLSSKSFEELLLARNLTNTAPMEFKAKYQKRVHLEDIPVCLNPEDVALYCECICEHLKCCYNLFGPNLYDGDDCPGHCRALTKSNKFMKRATYYREKARLGEFLTDGGKKTNANGNNSASKTSKVRYAGRESPESTSSSVSRSEQVNSRASSAGDGLPINELKENLNAVEEITDEIEETPGEESCKSLETPVITDSAAKVELDVGMDKILHSSDQGLNVHNILAQKPPILWSSEFSMFETHDIRPADWTVDEVAEHLDWCGLSHVKAHIVSQCIDGQALLLLDKMLIREHFQQHRPKTDYSEEEVGKLCRFVEFVQSRAESAADA